ncbi:MAG TPA: hypothetical protein VFP59_03140 [Candidatus Angelobacter sp.]|nr:hypothetical protein [Candidatus Angelobacter sp.]
MRRALWLLLLLVSSFAAAQECTTYVVVPVVDHKTGEEIDNLKMGDFTAKSGHISLPIVSAEHKFSNRLLVLLETDGIASSDKLDHEIKTMTQLARQAPDGRPVAFGIYADRAVFSKDFSSDEKQRTTEINEIIEEAGELSGKHVVLFDTLLQALARFGPHQAGDTILLVGDPYDDNSHHSADDVEKEFLRSGIRLTIMLRQPLSGVSRDFMWSTHDREKQMFDLLTAKTGGSYTVYEEHLFDFPWKGYMLGVELPNGRRVPRKWKLQLNGPAGVADRHPKLYYPERLPPCSTLSKAAK